MEPDLSPIEPDEKGCYLQSRMRQCCCNCEYHWQDFHHCAISDERQWPHGECVCSKPKGWICVGMRFVGDGSRSVHSGWPEHSLGCEMYTPVKATDRRSDK